MVSCLQGNDDDDDGGGGGDDDDDDDDDDGSNPFVPLPGNLFNPGRCLCYMLYYCFRLPLYHVFKPCDMSHVA
jgi:hypothetical protein